ncbi:MAG: hypothetical protein R2780_10290 [Crocinitomicaceae bacterium]
MNSESNSFIFKQDQVETTAKPIIHNKKSRRNKDNSNLIEDVWLWGLYRYKGLKENSWMEQVTTTALLDSDSQRIDSKKFLDKLNSSDCFDFEYNPKEGDTFRILHESRQIIRNRKFIGRSNISFVFRESVWVEEKYEDENIELTYINSGSICWL